MTNIRPSGQGTAQILVGLGSTPQVDQARLIRTLEQATQLLGPLRVCDGWHEFQQLAGRADCALALVAWLGDSAAMRHLQRVRRLAPETALIVVTAKTAENARLALGLGIDDTLWQNDTVPDLTRPIRGALDRAFLRAVAVNAHDALHLPTSVREVVATACRHCGPIRTTRELASVCGFSRSAVASSWHRVAPHGPSPKVLLDWLLLLRACALRTTECSWASVGELLRVDGDTIARAAARLTGMRLSSLNSSSLERLRREFARGVLTPLGIRCPLNRMR